MSRKYIKAHILFEESGSVLSIDLETAKADNWLFNRGFRTNYKTADTCEILFVDSEKNQYRYSGYVPEFFPGKHFGDYIELSISKEGIVKDFTVMDSQIEDTLKRSNE